MNYLLEQLEQDQYYVLCMDYHSILNYLDEVENEDAIKLNDGNLIVDQLLVAGDGKNRFLTCRFSHGKILLETAENVIGTSKHRNTASRLLNQHFDLLKYSILSESQLELIQQGQAV